MIVRVLFTVLLVLAASPIFAEIPDDVKELSGVVAARATEATLKIDSDANAGVIKEIFVDALNSFAQSNKLLAMIKVQTFTDKKQIVISFATLNSKPIIIINIIARNGELLIEHADCGDKKLVDYDWREKAKEPGK
jgi:hypothetical protein